MSKTKAEVELGIGKLCRIIGDYPRSGTIGEIIGKGPKHTDSWEFAGPNFVFYIPSPSLSLVSDGELSPQDERDLKRVGLLKKLAGAYHTTKRA